MNTHALWTCSTLMALVWLAGADEPTSLRLATTTSTDDSGLLEWLLPGFEQASGIRVEVIAVGTGKALRLGENAVSIRTCSGSSRRPGGG